MVSKDQLITILKNPANLTLADSMFLTETIKKYPFFQAAKAIELKALKTQNSHLYNQKLKVAAAHTVDRGVLFHFITSKKFNTVVINKKTKPSVNSPENYFSENINYSEKSIKMTQDEADRIVDPKLFETKVSSKNSLSTVTEEKNTEESKLINGPEALDINAPLNFDKNEKHSFSEWLKLTSIRPIEREKPEQKTEAAKPKSKLIESPLIDSFLKNNPKIAPVKPIKPTTNLASQNAEISENLMTETLAKVYLTQNNYKKAIQAYKILSLKNPEKSGLFADRIRAIEKLQKNNEK